MWLLEVERLVAISHLCCYQMPVTRINSGLTVASRLAEDPSLRILVIEAGLDEPDDPIINDPAE